MSTPDDEPLLLTRYRAWLSPLPVSVDDDAARSFFGSAVVVLDTNVLLDLYRYTPTARQQVLEALHLVAAQHRLWLPHQVGLEFVRNRTRTVRDRHQALISASKNVDTSFQEAARSIGRARDAVAALLRDLARDDHGADELTGSMTNKAIDSQLREWHQVLIGHVRRLRESTDLTPASMGSDDPLLPEIAALFGSRIGEPIAEAELRRLVDHATTYRFPNRIPPGFEDKGKSTDLHSAGDFLLWEEIIRHAGTLPRPRRVLLVSRDTKPDWYEHDSNGSPMRPWPALNDELAARADAELLVLTPKEFFRGAQRFLGAELAAGTYDEFDRVSAQTSAEPAADGAGQVTGFSAGRTDPGPLAEEARRSAGLLSPEAAALLQNNSRFAWWLIGITAELGIRNAAFDEPAVDIPAVSFARPAESWLQENIPLSGGIVSAWVPPWMTAVLRSLPPPDLSRVRRLIGTALRLSDQ
ncbi:PIN-like domain-containing protein [Actinoplanes sp. NPDC000266]